MISSNERNFLKIRYDLIVSKKLDNLTLYVYILSLALKGKLSNSYNCTLKGLVELCGYVVDRHKGKSIDKVKSTLKVLCAKGLLTISDNIDELKPTTLFDVTVNELGLCFDDGKSFAMLEDYEFKLLLSKKDPARAEMLRCFLSVKGRMYSYNDNEIKISNPTISQLKRILQASSDQTACYIIDKLAQLEMLYIYQVFYKTKSGLTKKRNFYSVEAFNPQMKSICETMVNQYLGNDAL